ncbi:MAG: endonuclease III [Deltaproteobacteria bacterium RBG_19FT_COMBO_43_11]|nr:MAG: endonuclease III [Deltaproteobacteria bacterium RBG_16_44_11]OGP87312.1 MAG: endonuclease III [Deltaproteobacteria bacterium RBG_19FT_COMBO_43_11]
MQDSQINTVIKILKKELEVGTLPIVSHLAEDQRDPFVILISTLLSLRTKDEVTAVATERLFALASTPQEMLQISLSKIAKTIYPVGFYRVKARTIHHVSRELISRFNSKMPDDLDTLLSIKGVGRKTANLVVSLAYGKDGICVDTHVHRISNRLGYVKTKTPDETEFALRDKLPRCHWIIYNTIMVAFGRKTCKPVSPLCSVCPVNIYCERVGVTLSR